MKQLGAIQQRKFQILGSSLLLIILLLPGCIRQGVYHRVQPGQTLYRISKTYAVDEAYLARINNIPKPTQLRVGTRIFIPGATQKKYVPATVPGYAASGNRETVSTPPSRTSSHTISKPKKNKSIVKKRIPTTTTAAKKTKIKLHWPLRGKILRGYGEGKTAGGKGIEIAAHEGSEVKAAAAGKVIYGGDGVQGFGHLIILQHENDFFTVYGFNNRNHVKQGQFVSQGQKIASSGRPPSGKSGRLHFEVRIGKLAVNPILYLP